MRNFINAFQRKDLLAIILSTCVYVLLASQSLPLSDDDFGYRFHQATGEVITSFSDLISSNTFGYTHVNGRFLAHVFIQLFLAWDLHWLFILASAFAFVLLISPILYLFKRNLPSTFNIQHSLLIYPLFFLIAFWPLMATSCYGSVAMNINYLWTAAISTFFLSIYFHVSEDNPSYSAWKNIALFIFGLVCGSWQESFGIGIGGAICLYHLFHLRSTNKSAYYLIIGYGIGLCLLIFAPGNFARASAESVGGFIGLHKLIYQTTQLCKHYPFVDIWFGLGVLSLAIDTAKKDYFAFIKSNWLFFTAALIASIFTLYTIATGMYQGTWQLTILGVIDTILMLNFLKTYLPKVIESTASWSIALVSMCIFIGATYRYRHVLEVEKQAFIDEFISLKSDTAYDGRLQYAIQHSIPTYSNFIYEHTCDMYCSFYDERTLLKLSRYYTYGAESWGTAILPEPKEAIIANCNESNQISTCLYLAPLQYYIIRIPKDKGYTTQSLCIEVEHRYKKWIKQFTTPITAMPILEDSNYIYAVRTTDWWNFHEYRIKSVVLK